MKRLLAAASILALLAGAPVSAQTIYPAPGSGGSGTVTTVACPSATITTSGTCAPLAVAGTSGDVVTASGSNQIGDPGSLSLSASTLTVGNGTNSGIVFLDTTGGGGVNLFAGSSASTFSATLPDNSGTIAELNLAQTFSATQTFVAPVLGTPASVTLTNATALPVPGGLSATGTPSSTTFLRGDGAWATPAGGGSGCTVSGTANQVVSNNGSTGCQSDAATITTTGVTVFPAAGALSASSVTFSGAPLTTGGSGTTTFPLVYLNDGTGPTTFSTAGTEIGVNAPSGWAGNFLDLHTNGGASIFNVTSAGALNTGSTVTSGANVAVAAASSLLWTGRGVLSSPGTGDVQLGATDVAAPVAQTLSAQNVVAGNANTAGANEIIRGSLSNGTGAGGTITIQTSASVAASGTQNTGLAAGLFDSVQHFTPGNTASNPPTCGTGCASIAASGSDQRMLVTTGTAVTSVAVAFGKTWTNTPVCTATIEGATPVALTFSAKTTGGYTLTVVSALTAGVIDVLCD